jgi:NDP-sugar pyrophosphorylase family protein
MEFVKLEKEDINSSLSAAEQLKAVREELKEHHNLSMNIEGKTPDELKEMTKKHKALNKKCLDIISNSKKENVAPVNKFNKLAIVLILSVTVVLLFLKNA